MQQITPDPSCLKVDTLGVLGVGIMCLSGYRLAVMLKGRRFI